MTAADKSPYFPSRLLCPFLSFLGNLFKFLEIMQSKALIKLNQNYCAKLTNHTICEPVFMKVPIELDQT